MGCIKTYTPDHLITIDFETAYSRDFSLSKLTTEAYVRDERFEVIGVGVHDGEQSAWLEEEEFREWAREVDWSKCGVLHHNFAFDGFILAHHYGITPGIWFDTLSMARALHGTEVGGSLAKLSEYYQVGQKGDEVIRAIGKRREDFTQEEWLRYGDYCLQDTQLCLAIFNKMVERFPDDELWLIDTTLRMFTEGKFILDEPKLEAFIVEEKKRKADLLERVAKDRTTILSNDKFAALLVNMGIEPPTKISDAKTKTARKKDPDAEPVETWALAKSDPGMQALLEHERDEIRWLAEARVGVKSTINETRAERFLRMGRGGRPLPVALKYWGAHTGRWSGSDKQNMQNLQRGGVLRDCLLAPRGQVVVAADSGQIEARITAWMAEHDELVETFASGRDVYCEFGTSVFGREITKEDKRERHISKTCFSGDTRVLTDRGWLPLKALCLKDRVWDGVEWVTHRGLLAQGTREVLLYASSTGLDVALAATADHKILVGEDWREWGEVAKTPALFESALETAALPPGHPKPSWGFRPKTRFYSREMPVYDIASAGPRHRFTVLSDEGPLIVSNCILGLGYSMGWLKLASTFLSGAEPVQFTEEDAENLGVSLSNFFGDEAKMTRVEAMPSRLPLEERAVHCAVSESLVWKYRGKNKPIVQLWKLMERAIVAMIDGEEAELGPGGCVKTLRHGLLLPNGMTLRYPGLRAHDEEGRSPYSYIGGRYSKERTRIYGGSATENLIQALARIVVAEQVLKIRALGLPILTTMHDEVVSVVDEADGQAALDAMIEVMRTPPAWAVGMPLNADGGFGESYGECK